MKGTSASHGLSKRRRDLPLVNNPYLLPLNSDNNHAQLKTKQRCPPAANALWLGSVVVMATMALNGASVRNYLINLPGRNAIGREHRDISDNDGTATEGRKTMQKSNAHALTTNNYSSRTSHSKKRSKLHFCKGTSTRPGFHILQTEEFGYTAINATSTNDWDLIYGGYQRCGDSGESDWEMEQGLNKIMKARGDWEHLQPNQVFHPCMGCRQSYCNKRGLCNILRGIDPNLCYVLPNDLQQLKRDMIELDRLFSNDTQRKRQGSTGEVTPYVLKATKKHGSKGIKFIWHSSQLPKKDAMDGFIVQKWMEPHLFSGIFHRKSELRIHVAITSIFPLRAYYHTDQVVTLAARRYANTMMALTDKCMADTSSSQGCDVNLEKPFTDFLEKVPNRGRQIFFRDYVKGVDMSRADQELLLGRALQLTSRVIRAGHSQFESHPVNQALHSSSAMCFSHMRIDLGIGEDLVPFVYEVTEIPSKNGPGNVTSTVARDLFHLIGLDVPSVPVDERANFEREHLWGWRPLPVPVNK